MTEPTTTQLYSLPYTQFVDHSLKSSQRDDDTGGDYEPMLVSNKLGEFDQKISKARRNTLIAGAVTLVLIGVFCGSMIGGASLPLNPEAITWIGYGSGLAATAAGLATAKFAVDWRHQSIERKFEENWTLIENF